MASTLIKPVGFGKEVQISDLRNVINDYVIENRKECSKISIGDYKMFYKAYDNLLIPVHTFSTVCYYDKKIVKSNVVIAPASID